MLLFDLPAVHWWSCWETPPRIFNIRFGHTLNPRLPRICFYIKQAGATESLALGFLPSASCHQKWRKFMVETLHLGTHDGVPWQVWPLPLKPIEEKWSASNVPTWPKATGDDYKFWEVRVLLEFKSWGTEWPVPGKTPHGGLPAADVPTRCDSGMTHASHRRYRQSIQQNVLRGSCLTPELQCLWHISKSHSPSWPKKGLCIHNMIICIKEICTWSSATHSCSWLQDQSLAVAAAWNRNKPSPWGQRLAASTGIVSLVSLQQIAA